MNGASSERGKRGFIKMRNERERVKLCDGQGRRMGGGVFFVVSWC